ncbi:MAG: diaminopimelate epimerase [Candidatus Margulisiibacteriota bacterium]
MTQLAFKKYQGTGNDFVLIDATQPDFPDLPWHTIAKQWCLPHFGIGADGLILALPSRNADFVMKIFNADGSESAQCGNGIRCFTRFVVENGLTAKSALSVETISGIYYPEIIGRSDNDWQIRVNMGYPVLARDQIPLSSSLPDPVQDIPITVGGTEYHITGVSMGNPHAVIFVEDLSQIDLHTVGPAFQSSPLFPEKVNVEFVQVLSPTEAKVVVWERGSGPTLACGTGACAVAVAGALTGRLARESTIHLPGGALQILWAENGAVWMTGPAVYVFSGTIAWLGS